METIKGVLETTKEFGCDYGVKDGDLHVHCYFENEGPFVRKDSKLPEKIGNDIYDIKYGDVAEGTAILSFSFITERPFPGYVEEDLENTLIDLSKEAISEIVQKA